MNNGLTIKRNTSSDRIYDIHFNETASSGYGGDGGPSLVIDAFFVQPKKSTWDNDTYLRYSEGHTVFMPMCLVGWAYE